MAAAQFPHGPALTRPRRSWRPCVRRASRRRASGSTQYDRIDWGSSLNGYIGREVLQAIDGTRTGLDIYRLVAAEAREGGEHYYGVVRPEAVLALLQNVEQLGLVRPNDIPRELVTADGDRNQDWNWLLEVKPFGTSRSTMLPGCATAVTSSE